LRRIRDPTRFAQLLGANAEHTRGTDWPFIGNRCAPRHNPGFDAISASTEVRILKNPAKAARSWLAFLMLAWASSGEASKADPLHAKPASRVPWGQASGVSGKSPGFPARPTVALTHVAQIRQLSPAQAARFFPVQARGVVTAMPGYRNSFFFQDGTAGISVDRTDSTPVQVGDQVEVTGTSGPGQFAPVVLASAVRVIGQGRPPPAPIKTLGDLFGGMEDSQWIELRGVVRAAGPANLFGRPILILVLEVDGGAVNVQLQNFAGIDPARIVDSVIRVRGVCASTANDKRQFVGPTLLVPNRNEIEIVVAAPLDPFAGPVRPVGQVLKFGEWEHRVLVTGMVTYQVPGLAIYLQDGSDAIRVESPSPVIAVPGTRVEAIGFPATREYAPILVDGLFRIAGRGSPVPPVAVKAGAVITQRDGIHRGNYNQQLVQLEATLVEDHIQRSHHVFLVRQGNEEFEATLLLSGSAAPMAPLPVGSLLQLTGICTIQVGNTLNPISFELLLRTPQDIVVLERGPWWTPARSLSLLAILACVSALAFLWVAALRNRVKQQTKAIRESEIQFRYLAEHDGLTGLLNRGAILRALDNQMARARREHQPVTVVLSDIDHFKEVNDQNGHLAGDAALQRFAAVVSASMRPYDSAGRYGGEEFLLVLPGISETDVENRLGALHAAMSNLDVSYLQTRFSITCSFGAVVISDSDAAIDRDMFLSAADRALYQAKDAGRNRVVVDHQRVEAFDPTAPDSAA